MPPTGSGLLLELSAFPQKRCVQIQPLSTQLPAGRRAGGGPRTNRSVKFFLPSPWKCWPETLERHPFAHWRPDHCQDCTENVRKTFFPWWETGELHPRSISQVAAEAAHCSSPQLPHSHCTCLALLSLHTWGSCSPALAISQSSPNPRSPPRSSQTSAFRDDARFKISLFQSTSIWMKSMPQPILSNSLLDFNTKTQPRIYIYHRLCAWLVSAVVDSQWPRSCKINSKIRQIITNNHK